MIQGFPTTPATVVLNPASQYRCTHINDSDAGTYAVVDALDVAQVTDMTLGAVGGRVVETLGVVVASSVLASLAGSRHAPLVNVEPVQTQ